MNDCGEGGEGDGSRTKGDVVKKMQARNRERRLKQGEETEKR